MTTPRIDTLRQRIAHTQHVLTLAEREIETLHYLAYERPTSGSPERTSGGVPDWALDWNGDTTARAALRTLAEHLTAATQTIQDGARRAIRAVKDRTPDHVDNSRHRARISAEELLAQFDAAERRRERGEYTPHRIAHQPVVAGTEAALRTQLKAARKENERLRRQVKRLETEGRSEGRCKT